MLRNQADTPNAYRNARTGLLNALEALGEHRETVTLVGGQAIHLHTDGRTDINTPELTFDADLLVEPKRLRAPPPTLEQVLRSAHFEPINDSWPGLWHQRIVVPELEQPISVEVDLLVPASVSGPGRRGARLGDHGNKTAAKTSGLDAALVDRSPRTIRSLDPSDLREYTIPVAGPGALLIAKMFKIRDRLNDGGDRVKNKDAADVLRLLIATETQPLAENLKQLRAHAATVDETTQGLELLQKLGGSKRAPMMEMARQALRGQDDPDQVTARFAVLVEELLNAVK